MSTNGAMPSSFLEALDTSRGYIVAILGLPGTGKSLFASELFRSREDTCLLITTSENIEFTRNSISGFSDSWEDRFIPVSPNTVSVEDCAGSTLSDVLSPFVESPKGLETADVVIIDSWSNLLHYLRESDRARMQRLVTRQARESKKRLVLVAEGDLARPLNVSLRHLSDLVVNLRKIHKHERMYRELVIEKMRCHALEQEAFLFTLHNGRFTSIPWYQHQYPAITIEKEPIEDLSDQTVSTGNESLDDLLGGGLKKGSMNLLEVENLAAPYLETIYIPFLSNHLNLGRPAIVLLPEGWSPDRFIDGLRRFVGTEKISHQVVFFGRQTSRDLPNCRELDDDPWKTLQEIRYESTQLEREFNQTATALLSLDSLENRYGVRAVRSLVGAVTASLSQTGRVIMGILGMNQDVKSESLSPNTHLRIEDIDGVLSLHGMIPRSNYLAVKPIRTTGFMDYSLIPIE